MFIQGQINLSIKNKRPLTCGKVGRFLHQEVNITYYDFVSFVT